MPPARAEGVPSSAMTRLGWFLVSVAACGAAELESTPVGTTSGVGGSTDGATSPTNADGTSTGGADVDSGDAPDAGGGDTTTGGDTPGLDAAEQVIYLVMPDRFVDGDVDNDLLGPEGCFDPADARKFHGGDLQGVRDRLDHLGALGVTTLWITPVYAQSPDRCGYHGYWADFADPDDGAMQPTLGTLEDLQGLADDLHAAGQWLVLDMVVNHAGPGARVVQQRPEWFHDPDGCARLGPAEVYCPIGGSPLPDFAQEVPEVADYLDAQSVGWIERVAFDGVRMDTVKHVPVEYWNDGWIPAVRDAKPELFVVGEVFDTGSTEKLVPYLDAGFDSLFNFPLMAELGHVFGGGGSVNPLASRVAEQAEVLGQARLRALTSFVDNHDVPRFTSAVADADPEEIHRRYLLALGALFTLPGIPMLYYGDEVGLLGAGDPDNRRDMPSWAFTDEGRAVDHPDDALPGADVTFARVQQLIALRREHPALVRGDYVELWRKGGQAANIFAFVRTDVADPIVVAFNNGAEAAGPVDIRIAANEALSAADLALFTDGTELVELLGAGGPAAVTITEGELRLSLPGRTMAIYSRAR